MIKIIFDINFISDSYSCRKEKGVHKGVLKLEEFLRKDTNNYRNNTFALKCDVREFFDKELSLGLHPKKVEIRKNSWGVDFLGYVLMPHYKVVRTKTKKRMISKITEAKKQLDKNLITTDHFQKLLSSYKGVLSHCKGYKINKNIDIVLNLNNEIHRHTLSFGLQRF